MELFVLVAALALVWDRRADATTHGAPHSSCNTMAPKHKAVDGTFIQPQPIQNQPYQLRHNMCRGYQAGKQYRVTIAGAPFSGFYCRLQKTATIAQTDVVGLFVTRYLPRKTIVGQCHPADSAVTHGDPLNWNSLTFVWKAPSSDSGPIQLVCTMAQSHEVFWVALRSKDICFNNATDEISCGDPQVHPSTCSSPVPTTCTSTNSSSCSGDGSRSSASSSMLSGFVLISSFVFLGVTCLL